VRLAEKPKGDHRFASLRAFIAARNVSIFFKYLF
jgi:hypothetical protein